ncbi:complement C3-like [Gigantopelta aegis]|uniref:complement C3-like n=1 Tax=Gigantopelta aegis TaxID=1735272 RepID=UPI001B888FF7|nr:complement C3-like [Gigantopelta aegis]
MNCRGTPSPPTSRSLLFIVTIIQGDNSRAPIVFNTILGQATKFVQHSPKGDGILQNATFSLDLDDVYARTTKVYLMATDGVTHVHQSLELDRSTGYIIIQTDKPFYTPRQTVRYRVVALGEDQHWAPWKVRIDIISPEGIVLERTVHSSKDSFTGKTFQLPKEPTLGDWQITASFITHTKHTPKSKDPKTKDLDHNTRPNKTAVEHSVIQEDVSIFTQDHLQLHLTISATYFIRTIDSGGLHKQTGVKTEYRESIKAAVIDAIKTVAVQFLVKDYASRREFVESQMRKDLWSKVSSFCCHSNNMFTKCGCRPVLACNNKNDTNLFVGFINFHIVKVPIPTMILSHLGIPKTKRPVTGKVKPTDQSSSITKITIGKNVSTTFEVKEYVLPTFSASLEVSTRVILETTKNFTIRVRAKYLHQKGITGNAVVRLGVVRRNDVALFHKVYYKEIEQGYAEIMVNVSEWRASSLWFPSSGSVLYVGANVTDESSLETQTLQNQSTVFAFNVFSFLSIHDKYFIPEKAYNFVTKLVYANDDPAAGIQVKGTIHRSDGRKQIQIGVFNKVTSINGEIHVNVPANLVPGTSRVIYFKVTKEKDLLSRQRSVTFQVTPAEEESISGRYLSLKVLPSKTRDVLLEVTHTAQLLADQSVYLHILASDNYGGTFT